MQASKFVSLRAGLSLYRSAVGARPAIAIRDFTTQPLPYDKLCVGAPSFLAATCMPMGATSIGSI